MRPSGEGLHILLKNLDLIVGIMGFKLSFPVLKNRVLQPEDFWIDIEGFLEQARLKFIFER